MEYGIVSKDGAPTTVLAFPSPGRRRVVTFYFRLRGIDIVPVPEDVVGRWAGGLFYVSGERILPLSGNCVNPYVLDEYLVDVVRQERVNKLAREFKMALDRAGFKLPKERTRG